MDSSFCSLGLTQTALLAKVSKQDLLGDVYVGEQSNPVGTISESLVLPNHTLRLFRLLRGICDISQHPRDQLSDCVGICGSSLTTNSTGWLLRFLSFLDLVSWFGWVSIQPTIQFFTLRLDQKMDGPVNTVVPSSEGERRLDGLRGLEAVCGTGAREGPKGPGRRVWALKIRWENMGRVS